MKTQENRRLMKRMLERALDTLSVKKKEQNLNLNIKLASVDRADGRRL